MLINILIVIASIGIVIFVHELGHFIVAKKTGVKVEKFYVGLGPEVIGITYKETRYGIAAFPIGGIVKLAGEEPSSEHSKEGDFFFQPWYKRICVALAGSIMNLLLAIFLFFLTVYFWGIQKPSGEAVIGELREGYPAYRAGLKVNDRIVSINGNEIKNWKELSKYIHARPQQNIKIKVLRDGRELIFELKTARAETDIGLIGIGPQIIRREVGFFESVKFGVAQSFGWNYVTLRYLVSRIKRFQAPEIAGPVGIVQVMTKTVEAGAQNYLFILAIISNALAFFNLFPIPLLDGGHIMLFLVEGILKKPIDKKYIEKINTVGLAIILTIFLFATYSDLVRLWQ
jgi:regulator of sigma E protease